MRAIDMEQKKMARICYIGRLANERNLESDESSEWTTLSKVELLGLKGGAG